MSFRVAVAQFTPVKADVEANLDRIAEIARQAQSEGAELAAFPEAATTGYFLEGGVLENALSADELCMRLGRRLEGIERPLDVAVGFYEKAGGELYNSAAYLEFRGGGGRVVHIYRKFFLPTYGVFDEERFVARGRELGLFQTRLGPMGFLICEDLWHSILGTLLAMSGAGVVLVPSASPARNFGASLPGNVLRYERMLRALSEEHGVYALLPMLCGFEGGKGLAGGSMAFDPTGALLARAPLLEDHMLVVEIDPDLIAIARSRSPLLSDLQSCWSDVSRIARGIPT